MTREEELEQIKAFEAKGKVEILAPVEGAEAIMDRHAKVRELVKAKADGKRTQPRFRKTVVKRQQINE